MKTKSPQTAQMLRLLVGGYLVYLGYDLFRSGSREILILACAVLFALIGGALLVFSAISLFRSGVFSMPEPEEEETRQTEE